MGNLIQSNISFTVNASETIGGFGHKRSHASVISNNKYSITKKQTLIDNNAEEYGGFSINAIDIDWNSAEVGNDVIIKNTGDFISWIKNSLNDKIDSTDVYSKDDIDAALSQIDGGGTLDPSILNGYVTIESYNELLANYQSLLARVEALEQGGGEQPPVQTYNIIFKDGAETLKTVSGATGTVVEAPANPEKEGYTFSGWSTDGETVILPVANIGTSDITYIAVWTEIQQGPETAYALSTQIPTLDNIGSIVNTNTTKPEEPIELDMTGSTLRPGTIQYLIYPLEWEESSNGEITKPVINDTNNFEIGFFADDDTPTIVYEGITYRICDIELGKMVYTITF